jgi:hypothetical protein
MKKYKLEIDLQRYFNEDFFKKYPVVVVADSLEKAKEDLGYMGVSLSFSGDEQPWLNDTFFCNFEDAEDLKKVKECA